MWENDLNKPLLYIPECECDIRGIAANNGCNQEDGKCTCKRFVINRDCDQCLDEHYGLSESDPNGCKPCECDIGGAIDNECDVITGQCKCRPHIEGRQCDKVQEGYFTGALDFILFEGELANATGSTIVIK